MPFQEIFRQQNDGGRVRAKFLSRVFGIFSEKIVELWTHNAGAAYASLGRPTIHVQGADGGINPYTLDFTLQHRGSGRVFIAEMKCEIEFNNFRYLVLERPDQLEHHNKPAFAAIKEAAINPHNHQAYVNGHLQPLDGAILIWGAATQAGKNSVVKAYGFHDVLTIEEICCDLVQWNDQVYSDLIETRRQWCNELFDGLISCRLA